MSAGWVAAGVRGRGLVRRCLGSGACEQLGSQTSLADAVALLSHSPYGRDVRAEMGLSSAQHAVSATVLWHLRVLAGWGPPLGATQLRLVAGSFEITNVVGHLHALAGHEVDPAFVLGALATAWPRVAQAPTPAEVRRSLATSPWGDPGSEDPATVGLVMQFGWARRIADGAPEAAGWATAYAALVAARTIAAEAVPVLAGTGANDSKRLLGPDWDTARSVGDLGRRLPRRAAWVLAGIEDPDELWRAEARWWERVEYEAASVSRSSWSGAGSALGSCFLLVVDGWRVRAALEMAARGGGSLREVTGAVA